jgi:hypothetical protein
MTNRIQQIRIQDGPLDLARVEVWIDVYPEILTSTTQVRGRLMGPRCPYAGTVEVAYPFREVSREYQATGIPHLSVRAVIPEANLWDPISPFLYHGPVELWQNGQLCETVPVSHGFRSLNLGPHGLRWNGQPLTLRGVSRSTCSEAEERALHQANINTLLVPAGLEITQFWEIGDVFGLLVLGRITTKADVKHVSPCEQRPSGLGWLVNPDLFEDELSRVSIPALLADGLWGIEVRRVPAELPPGASFIAVSENLLAAAAEIPLPKMVLSKANPADSVSAQTPGHLGWIQESR